MDRNQVSFKMHIFHDFSALFVIFSGENPPISYVCMGKLEIMYRKVASSRPVHYLILDSLCQRSKYISIKLPFISSLKIKKCATN